jgi:hypothetical protein
MRISVASFACLPTASCLPSSCGCERKRSELSNSIHRIRLNELPSHSDGSRVACPAAKIRRGSSSQFLAGS